MLAFWNGFNKTFKVSCPYTIRKFKRMFFVSGLAAEKTEARLYRLPEAVARCFGLSTVTKFTHFPVGGEKIKRGDIELVWRVSTLSKQVFKNINQ